MRQGDTLSLNFPAGKVVVDAWMTCGDWIRIYAEITYWGY